MDITVNVDNVSLETVVREYRDDEGHQYTIGDMVADRLARHVIDDRDAWPPFRDAVLQIRDDEIRAAITPKIAEALNGTRKQTNSFGEETGPATTLAEIIAAEARKQLAGKTGDHYSSDRRSVVEKLVADAVSKAFGSVIADEVKKARELVGDQIGDQVAAAVKAGLAKR
jgi:hypothetical protein